MPLRSLMLFFNDLVFLRMPHKSLKFHSSLFSLPTDRVCLQLKTGELQFFRGA
jgi:hypothetical protein